MAHSHKLEKVNREIGRGGALEHSLALIQSVLDERAI